MYIQGWLAHLVCHLAPCFPWNSSCGRFQFEFYSKEFPPHTNIIQVGVATSSCPLTEPGYRRFQDCLNSMASSLVRLVGSNSSSWGWCLKTMKVYHDSRKYRHGVPYPRLPIVFDHLMKYLWSLNPVLAFTVTLRQCETCIRDVDEKLRVPETFYMLLDMDRGTLAFQVNIL